MKPFLLKPACKDYVWGGNLLRSFGKCSDADRIAESWELSCHPEGESVIASGEFAGLTLTQFLREHPEAVGENCRKFADFPVLVKLIDAHDDLSVQVHPDDAYAAAHGGGLGKTELWYILAAEPGAEILYGVEKKLTHEEFRRAIEEHTLLDTLRHIPVHEGDVFFVPAGTLHAIGKGILLAEIQQNSNTTYRVYDYGRIGTDGLPRELHTAQALETASLTPTKNPVLPPETTIPLTNCRYRELGHCGYFSAAKFDVLRRLPLTKNDGSFEHFLVTDGSGVLYFAGGELAFAKGDSIFVPQGTACSEIRGNCSLLYTTVW